MTKTFQHASQLIESKATSLNQAAATFSKVEFAPGSLNLDYGGGRYDKAAELLASKGAVNAVYDPFNRGAAHNLAVRLEVARRGGADSATVNNVLNVIAEPEALREVVEQAANGLREGASAHFLIHEGDRSGIGRATPKGWQRNEKAAAYEPLIAERFGKIVRKGNLIHASDPVKSPRSLFDPAKLPDEIMQAAKAAGVPMPSARHGAGKLIGGRLYLHKSAWGRLPPEALARALAALPAGFDPAIAKWDPKSGVLSLIESAGFDHEHEPAIQRAATVRPDGTITVTPERADPQIYHHKWCFVDPGYEGFDRLASVLRSLSWAGCGCDRARIGTLSHWDREVVWPHLGGVGARTPEPGGPSPSKRPAKPKARS